jgi:polyisoprenoid-binding protein YceI
MVVSSFTGRFTSFDATLEFEEQRLDASRVAATVDVASIDTGNEQREAHLRSDDFFNAEQYPTMTFESTRIERDGDNLTLYGNLTIRDVTRPVVFDVEYGGQVQDPWGNVRTGFVAETTINRKEFGLNWNALIETGGAVVGDKVRIKLHIEATRTA